MRKFALVSLAVLMVVGSMAVAAEAQTGHLKTTGEYVSSTGVTRMSFTKDSDGNITMWMSYVDYSTGEKIFVGCFYCDYDEWTEGVGGTFYSWWILWWESEYRIEYISDTVFKLHNLRTGTVTTMSWTP
jgi:hypothetical protein